MSASIWSNKLFQTMTKKLTCCLPTDESELDGRDGELDGRDGALKLGS